MSETTEAVEAVAKEDTQVAAVENGETMKEEEHTNGDMKNEEAPVAVEEVTPLHEEKKETIGNEAVPKAEVATVDGAEPAVAAYPVENGAVEKNSTSQETAPVLQESAPGPDVNTVGAAETSVPATGIAQSQQEGDEGPDVAPQTGETAIPPTTAAEDSKPAPGEIIGQNASSEATAETLVDLKGSGEVPAVATMPPLKLGGFVKPEIPTPRHVKKGEVLKRPQDVTTVVTRNGKTWNEMFEALVDYKKEHGDCYVPDRFKNEDGVCLGLWVRNQRRREDSLTEEQHKRLTELGLDWQTQNERFDNVWHERYAKLTEYRVDHGDCKVPYTYKADPALAKWVSQQRAQQAQGRLAPDRKAKLDAIDFSWKLNTVKNRNTKTEDKKWTRQYEKLVAFHQEHGHCKVPDRYKPDRPLGTWVKKQRLANACHQLKEDRKKMLDDLDFVWRITDKTDGEKWNRMFEKLKNYKEEFGTCHVSRTVPDQDLKPLARWVKTQRALYKSGKILDDRKARLDTIGFVWDGTQLTIKRKRRRSTDEGEKPAQAEAVAKKARTEELETDKKPSAEEAKAPEKKVAAKRVLPTSSQKATNGAPATSEAKESNSCKAEAAMEPLVAQPVETNPVTSEETNGDDGTPDTNAEAVAAEAVATINGTEPMQVDGASPAKATPVEAGASPTRRSRRHQTPKASSEGDEDGGHSTRSSRRKTVSI